MKTFLKFATVVIISKTSIQLFAKRYPFATEPLNNWYKITKTENWGSFSEVKKTFNSVDAVGNDRYCFNIKGNDYRLIVLILFRTRTVFILWFGSHAEYNKLNKSLGAANIAYGKQ